MSLVALQTKEPIPGYRLRERLGAGGYGEVWKAEAPGELYKAIKFVYGQLDEERASRELKALHRVRGVRHPFILSLERIEIIDGQLIIVTELADCSLKDCFDKYRKQGQPGIPREELLSYMRDAADALDYMNKQHSLQHLDVKPENLLMTAGRIKVADFGLVKDIEEHTVSMMGGLTPVYAPPEVFEGSPTRFSDQYSLAIVFQEMLTGQLPFPGKTAAQLAAQHLNAKPRLAPLPESDRPAIQRALSKKPGDRFGSCVEMIQAIERGGQSPNNLSSPVSGATVASQPPTQSLSVGVNESAATEAARSVSQMLSNLEEVSNLAAPGAEVIGPAGDAVDLPPPSSLNLQYSPKPTLFVGVGGAANRILQRLRHRWDDRLNPLEAPPVQFLLVDSDPTDLLNAARGDDGSSFSSEEVLETPLRKSQDYRQDSGALLDWLSRRWLYNIPRSLKTEGLRPLGRLAFVDHAPAIFARLREMLQALRETTQARKSGTANCGFRVVLVAASSGGTGGGMVLDLGFAVKQILDELKIEGDVDTVLVHGTNRVPAQQELAQANTFALLRELNHYQQPAGYPGDIACHLAPRPGERCGSQAVYAVHLGDELTPEQYVASLDQVAEFLFLGAATLTGTFLEAVRKPGASEGAPGSLRSFGLCPVGFSSDEIVDHVSHLVCRESIARWIGGPRSIKEVRSKTTTRQLLNPCSTQNNVLAGLEQFLVARATEMVNGWKIKAEGIVAQIQALAEEELGGNVNQFCEQVAGDPTTANVAAIEQLFGPRDPQADVPEARRSVLRLTLDDRMQPARKTVGTDLRHWIEGLVELPEARLFGAKWICRWFRDYFKLQIDQLRELRQRVQVELDSMEVFVREGLDPRLIKSSNGKKAAQELTLRRVAYCKLRLTDMSLLVAGQLFVAWQSYVAQAADGLQELSGDLEHWANRYPEYDFDQPVPQPTRADPLATLRPIMGQSLCAQINRLAAEVETKLTKEFCPRHGGVRATLQKSGEDRLTLTRELERLARQAVLRSLSQVNMQELLFEAKAGDRPLVDLCLEAATPNLANCGGERRLACLLPQPITEKAARQTMERLNGTHFRSLPTILPALGSDVVLLYEYGQLSLPHVAARLVDQRHDVAEIADRLQTRVDVDWRPLPTLQE